MESILMLYIMQAHIIDIERAEDAHAVLRRAADVLEQEGCVTPAYFDSLVEREQLSSTDLDNIAVPHGNPDFVQRTQLLILRLKTPVHWKLSNVQTVFIFAVSRADFQKRFRLISSFYKRLSHPDVREGCGKTAASMKKSSGWPSCTWSEHDNRHALSLKGARAFFVRIPGGNNTFSSRLENLMSFISRSVLL